jgi:hypothetical protein
MAKFVPLQQEEEQQPTVPGSRFVPMGEPLAQPPAPREPAAPVQLGEAAAPQQLQQLQEGPTPMRLETPRTFGEGAQHLGRQAAGVGEVGLTLASGEMGAALGGLEGILQLIRTGSSEEAAAAIEAMIEQFTYQPRTEEGQHMLERVGSVFEPLERGADAVGRGVSDVTGSPAAGAAAYTGLVSSPGLIGARVPRGAINPRGERPRLSRGEVRDDVQRVKQGARDEGVSLGAGFTEQREQIIRAGQRRVEEGGVVAGEGVHSAQVRLQEIAAIERANVTRLYEAAKSGDVRVPREALNDFFDNVIPQIKQDFVTLDTGTARRLVRQAEALKNLPDGSAVKLNAMERWHKAINRAMPDQRTDPAGYTGMQALLKAKENLMDTLLDSQLIIGDPNDIQAWRRAREASRGYKTRFQDEKVIRNMVNMQADPTEVRKWIFGANAAGFRPEATKVVRRIKQEVGEDSPQFTALRADAALDLLEPLLQNEPNFRQFIKRYDDAVRRNPEMPRELFGESLEGFQMLRDLARANQNRPVGSLSELPGMSRALSVAAFGHQLARKSLFVRAGASGIKLLTDATGKSAKRRVMADILGYDPYQPMFGAGSAIGAGAAPVLTSALEESREQGRIVGGEPAGMDDLSRSARGVIQRVPGLGGR